jgi:hypothetical protein
MNSIALKSSKSRWKWLLGVVVLAALIFYCAAFRRVGANLLPHGKAEFFRSGILYRDRFPLSVFRGQWHIGLNTNPHYGDQGGGDLIVPFDCHYNGAKTLEFDEGGKAYLLDRKTSTRTELRVVDGEWSYDASDHWQSIFDFGDMIGSNDASH